MGLLKKIFCLVILLSFLGCKDKENQALEQNEIKFRSIFNGRDLEGWRGDLTYWRVEDGILTGEVTPETILKRNSFIIYEKEQPDNFELKLEFRITNSGNSGINYRSEIMEDVPFALRGYQCDIDGKKKYTGQNYEEKKRTTLAYVGEKVSIQPSRDSISPNNLRVNIHKNCWQTRAVEDRLGNINQLRTLIKENDWNEAHIIAKGFKIQHYINGVLMSEITDLDSVNRTLKGYIGVQVHVGPPMKVEYKNIRIKKL